MDYILFFYSLEDNLFFLDLLLKVIKKYLNKEPEVTLDFENGLFIKCKYFSITIEDETKEYYVDMETNAQFAKKEYNLNVNKSFDIYFLSDYIDNEEIYGGFLKIIRDITMSTDGDFVFFEYDLSGFIFKREKGKIRLYKETARYNESNELYNKVFNDMQEIEWLEELEMDEIP